MANDAELSRFVTAQEPVYDAVVAELRAGRKRSHWMWFVFPQIAGLGRTATAQRFAITSLDEARAYLEHPVLGPRLRECTALVVAVDGASAEQVFGYPDYLKFRSSMTLFARATDDNAEFVAALDKFYDGEQDTRTVELL